MKTTTVEMIEVSDWDELVTTTYGRPYSFQQQDGCKDRGIVHITVPEKWPEDYENDVVPEVINHDEMGVSFAAWLARDPEQPLAKVQATTDLWWYRNFYPSIGMVINDLHSRGLVEAGEYVIDIDW